MAYNASIAEQFEVIQSWLSGGNSSGSLSVPDPFIGVAEAGCKRHYRFEIGDKVVRVPLDGCDSLHDEPRPLVRLEWGVYAFTPSTIGLDFLRHRARARGENAQRAAAASMPWSVAAGRAAIERLRRIEREQGDAAAITAWKTALEDAEEAAEFRSSAIWAAIRSDYGGVLRTPYGVLIGSRELIQHWMSEHAHAVSVAGYMPRMRNSFGPIFLGMDAGPDYQREVGPALEGIRQLEQLQDPHGQPVDPFDLACQCTKKEIDRLVSLAQQFARDDETLRRAAGGAPIESVKWDVTIDLRELVDNLLATFCEAWYGLSEDGGFLSRGGFSWAWQYGDPARYPGHFMAPSRAFFQPHPGLEVEQTGSLHGQALAHSMKGFLEAFGDTLKAHKPALGAVLDSDVAQGDPNYAARTIIGMIMGFVPTVDGVLRRALAQWGNDGTLWTLRAARGSVGDPDLKAQAELEFVRAMQLRTTPESLWRTATRSFRLDGEGASNAVDVVAGDALIFGLMSATQQCLSMGDVNTALSFSGDRKAAPRPTHACPGRQLAMRMMLGFVQALVTSAQPLRPGAAPSTFAVAGRTHMPVQPAAPQQGADAPVQVHSVSKVKLRRRKRHGVGYGRAGQQVLKADRTGTVPFWAIGDSWLDNLAGPFPDLVTSLGQLGYAVTDSRLRHANKGFPLAHLAQPEFLAQLQQDFSDAEQGIGSVLPEFIILGGGGNDIVGEADRPNDAPLFGMLKPGATNPTDAIDRGALDRFLDTMKGHYKKILDVLCASAPKTPIFIHAYDHPIPDGRGFLPRIGPGPWLEPLFDLAHLTDPAVNTDVMHTLIDALNKMVSDLAEDQPEDGRQVHHLRLAGVLASAKEFGDPKTDKRYQAYWNDELHPLNKGCDALAAAVAAQLDLAGVRKPGS
jgi:lysophospholipase L1-like esterase